MSEGRITTNWLGKVCVTCKGGTETFDNRKPQLWMKNANLKSLFA